MFGLGEEGLRETRWKSNESGGNDGRLASFGAHEHSLAVSCRLYPYSILPHILPLLAALPVSCPTHQLVPVLEVVLTLIADARALANGERETIASCRERDWLEGRVDVLREVLSAGALQDPDLRRSMPLTEHALCACDVVVFPRAHDVEVFVQQRAMDMDDAGLIADAVELVREGAALLQQVRGVIGDIHIGKMLTAQAEALDSYVAYAVLVGWAQGTGVLSSGAVGLSMMEYTVMEGRERMLLFLETCVSVGAVDWERSGMGGLDVNDGSEAAVKESMWILRHEHLKLFVGTDGNSVSMLHEILVEMAYQRMEWILAFVRQEAADPDGPVVMGSVEALGSFCCDVLRRPPSAEVRGADVETVLTFQVLISEVAQELADREQSLSGDVSTVNRAFKVSALMDQLGTSVMLDEAFRMMAHNQECVGLMFGMIEERYEEQMSKRGWKKLFAALSKLVVELGLADVDAQSLFEAGCRSCLRLGHIGAAEDFLAAVDASKREGLVIACAYDVLESTESTSMAKKILGLASESEQVRKDLTFVETLASLQSHGIEISLREVKKSANASQIFRGAICNATSTKGLRDVDAIVGLSERLGTGLSRTDVLLMLGETSFELQDALLCNRACVELIEGGTCEALPIVTKVVDSPEFLAKLDGRNSLVSFALKGARGDVLLKMLNTLRERGGFDVGDGGERGGVGHPQRPYRDERSAVLMAASAVFGQDAAATCSALDSRDTAGDEPDRAFYVGAICGTAAKVIVSSIDGADPTELLCMPPSALCQWACACLEVVSEDETICEYREIMRRLGASLVAAADEQRVSVINDKHAEDLWATGDANAQRHVLMQMTEKIAASRVSQFGTVSPADVGPFVVGLASATPEHRAAGSENLDNVLKLAHRCGTTYDDIEAALFRGVLHRHGASEAFGDTLESFFGKHPRDALNVLLEFCEDTDGFVSNWEVERTMRMIERVVSLLDGDGGQVTRSCRGTVELCETFLQQTRDAIPLEKLLVGVFDALRSFDQFPVIGDETGSERGGGCGDLGDDGIDHQALGVEDVEPEFAIHVYALLAGLVDLWPRARLVEPLSVLLGAWAKSGWSLAMLEGLGPDLIVKLAASYMDTSSQPDASVLRGVLGMTVGARAESKPGRQALLRCFVELSIQICQKSMESAMMTRIEVESWVTAVVGAIDGHQHVSCIVDRLSAAAVVGLPYVDIVRLAHCVTKLVHEARCMNNSGDVEDEGAEPGAVSEMIETAYSRATRSCTDVLKGGDGAKMSAGEAVQSIFAIVQSLDQVTPRAVSDQSDDADGRFDTVRSMVYETLKKYLNGTTVVVDVLHSEVQIQLMEMMMALGKRMWAGWQSGDHGDELRIPIYSRLVSHFSTSWNDALAGLEATGFTTAEDAGLSLASMAQRADDGVKALALWRAVVDILQPTFGDGGDAFRKGALAISMAVLSHADVDSVLVMLDEYTSIFGGMPEASWDAIDARVGGNDTAALAKVLFGDFSDGTPWEGVESSFSSQPTESLVRLLQVEGGSERSIADLRVPAAIALTLLRKTPAIPARGVKAVCRALRDDVELACNVTLVASDGRPFACPVRVLVFSHIVAQLVIDTDVPFARAAFVAFEFLCLERNLRVHDSAASAIHTVLAAIKDVQVDDMNTELREIRVLGKTRLARIIQEAPGLCREALTKLSNR